MMYRSWAKNILPIELKPIELENISTSGMQTFYFIVPIEFFGRILLTDDFCNLISVVEDIFTST